MSSSPGYTFSAVSICNSIVVGKEPYLNRQAFCSGVQGMDSCCRKAPGMIFFMQCDPAYFACIDIFPQTSAALILKDSIISKNCNLLCTILNCNLLCTILCFMYDTLFYVRHFVLCTILCFMYDTLFYVRHFVVYTTPGYPEVGKSIKIVF